MKRIVWLFGDGLTQYTHVDPYLRLKSETEDEQIERLKKEVAPILKPYRGNLDHSKRTPEEYAAYVASLGDGATAKFVGVISGEEYTDKLNRFSEFREAWTWVTPNAVIDIDMPRALEMKKNTLRELRAPLLAHLDTQFTRAVEAGDAKAQTDIAAQKQVLRDVTADPELLAATTPDELKAVMPAVLKGAR
jgi:hypothetical protein